jgi:hypothetical protein
LHLRLARARQRVAHSQISSAYLVAFAVAEITNVTAKRLVEEMINYVRDILIAKAIFVGPLVESVNDVTSHLAGAVRGSGCAKEFADQLKRRRVHDFLPRCLGAPHFGRAR